LQFGCVGSKAVLAQDCVSPAEIMPAFEAESVFPKSDPYGGCRTVQYRKLSK